jgi:hypothetical protein
MLRHPIFFHSFLPIPVKEKQPRVNRSKKKKIRIKRKYFPRHSVINSVRAGKKKGRSAYNLFCHKDKVAEAFFLVKRILSSKYCYTNENHDNERILLLSITLAYIV